MAKNHLLAPKVLPPLEALVVIVGVMEELDLAMVEVELAMVEVPNRVVIGEVTVILSVVLVVKPVEVGTVVTKVPLPRPVTVMLPTAVVLRVVSVKELLVVTMTCPLKV